MLILTRRKGEKIMVLPDVEISILNICGNQVKIGIDAPKDILILREEIIGRPKKEEPQLPIIKKKRRKVIHQPILQTKPLPATFYDDH